MRPEKTAKKSRSFTSNENKNIGIDNDNENVLKATQDDGVKPFSSTTQNFYDPVYKNKPKVAIREPELYVIGELSGGHNLGSGVCCRWLFDYGNMWIPLDGNIDGQTQVDYPSDGKTVVWSHPLDIHFLCKGLQGWPRLLLQVWKLNELGRLNVSGYGFVHIPNISGSYEMEISMWRPVGTLKEEIATYFLGTTPNLRDIDLLYRKAWSHRNHITTQSSGIICLDIDVVLRSFPELDIDK